RRRVAEADSGEVFQQVAEQRIRQAVLVRPASIAENAIERLGVGLLDATHRLLESLPDVVGDDADVVPVAAGRNLKAIVLRENGVLFVATGLSQSGSVLLVVDVGDALEKEQRKHVGFEIGGIDGTPED